MNDLLKGIVGARCDDAGVSQSGSVDLQDLQIVLNAFQPALQLSQINYDLSLHQHVSREKDFL